LYLHFNSCASPELLNPLIVRSSTVETCHTNRSRVRFTNKNTSFLLFA
jgi:hypothetical protein